MIFYGTHARNSLTESSHAVAKSHPTAAAQNQTFSEAAWQVGESIPA